MQCAIHQTMLQNHPIYGELYKARALESSKKRRRMSTRGDWICESCNHLNFYWRQSCRRCKETRAQDPNSTTHTPTPGPRVLTFRPGDWFCDVAMCQAHNFASRRFCFKCGTLKSIPCFGVGFYNPVIGLGYPKQEWKPGDWFCGRPDCYAHNYASRLICFKCKTSRESVTNASN